MVELKHSSRLDQACRSESVKNASQMNNEELANEGKQECSLYWVVQK